MGDWLARSLSSPVWRFHPFALDGSIVSPSLGAAAFSGLLPGATEFYNEHFLLSAHSSYDAEMVAASLAIQFITVNMTGCVTLFINNKSVLQTISQLHSHNGQHEALRINSMVSQWLVKAISNHIEVVWVPRHSGFLLNKHVDQSMKPLFIGPIPPKVLLLSSAIHFNKAQAISTWRSQFVLFQQGKSLMLKQNKKILLPSAWNNTSNRFLTATNNNQALLSQFTRSVTNHAPIGEYRLHFFLQEPTTCPCGVPIQSREHILCECPRYCSHFSSIASFYVGCNNFKTLVKFLTDNETSFTFEDAPVTLDDPP